MHGVIFVRRGLYRNGIFRFSLKLDRSYNSYNTHPIITFDPPVFNPLIHPETGVLDLKCDVSMQEWRPENHFIVHALTFLKKVFYVKSFDAFTSIANGYALSLLDSDKETYVQKIVQCIEYSQAHMYDISSIKTCNLVFTPVSQIAENNTHFIPSSFHSVLIPCTSFSGETRT